MFQTGRIPTPSREELASMAGLSPSDLPILEQARRKGIRQKRRACRAVYTPDMSERRRRLDVAKALRTARDPETLRRLLLDAVSSGLYSRERAEQKAASYGLGRLVGDADIAKFDQSAEPFWSVPMSLAWIVWRDENMVTRYSAKYREQCTYWFRHRAWAADVETQRPRYVEWDELSYCRPLTIFDVRLLAGSASTPPPQTTQDALESLLLALRSGKVTAHGVESAEAGTVDIRPAEWLNLRLAENQADTALRQNSSVAYSRLVIDAGAVRTNWLAASAAGVSVSASVATASGENASGITPEHPKNRRGRKAKYDWAAAREHLRALVSENGLPMAGDPEWSDQAAAEKAVSDWFGKANLYPGTSTVREHVSAWLSEISTGQKSQ